MTNTPLNPRDPIYSVGSPGVRVVRWAAAISMVAVLATVILVVVVWSHGPNPDDVYTIYILAALWAVLPAMWFWLEYFFVYRVYGNPGTLELFKHGQQTAIAIWAGVTLSLVAFAASDRFKVPGPDAARCECKCEPTGAN